MSSDSKPSPLEHIHPRSLKRLSDRLTALLRSRLWLQIIAGMLLGILVGYVLGPEMAIVGPETAEIIAEWLALPGYFFLAIIQMIVVPLVFSSVIRGIASNQNVDQLRKTGAKLVVYFLLTTAAAIVIGITLGKVLRPGEQIDAGLLASQGVERPEIQVEAEDLAADPEASPLAEAPQDLVGILPDNPLGAMVEANMLEVVLFAFILGLGLVSLKPATSKPLLDLLGALEAVSMTIVRWVMVIAPLAVFGLMAKVAMTTGTDVLIGLGYYCGVVALGLAVLLVFYMAVVFILGRRNPFTFIAQVRDPLIMAFSTDSSAATMPLSIKTAEEKLKVRPSTAQFVIPIGATVNMAGSALYQGLATMFIAQLYGIDLPIGALLALIVTIIGASIGTPATPGVGIIVLATVLTSAGIPMEGLTLIIGVDRILEMGRTTLNVTGDLVGCVILDRGMDKALPREAEMARQEELEAIREETGEDTLADPAAA